jgi:hypothetical protein
VILHVSAHPDWGADRQKATLTLFFLASGLTTAAAHGVSGLITTDVLGLLLWCALPLILGALAGAWLYRRLGQHGYRRFVFALLLAMGILLLVRSVF